MPADNRRNYYRILHVQPDAPAAVIRSSYRALMLKLEMHPDHGGEHWSATLLNEAYQVLSDPERRVAYDRALEWGWSFGSGQRAAGRPVLEAGRCVFCGTVVSPVATNRPACRECDGPLALAAKLDSSSGRRRRADRVTKDGPLRYFTAWPQRAPHVGVLRDLSPSGIRFRGEAEVVEYQIIKIESTPLSAIARVVFCRPSRRRELPFTIGADFYTVEYRRPAGTFVSTQV